MSNNRAFSASHSDLKKLFPRLDANEIEEIEKRFHYAESEWQTNLNRFKDKHITFLLICEAPPQSGQYFYKSTTDYLFKQVWKCFFGNKPICSNPNDAYQCLADIGFLLIDTLPYPTKYKSRHRRKPAYKRLIQAYLPIWVNTLNTKFSFDNDLQIAFGFKLNASAVIRAASGNISLGGKQRPLSPHMIAATGAGQPSSNLLTQKFGIKWGSLKCNVCL